MKNKLTKLFAFLMLITLVSTNYSLGQTLDFSEDLSDKNGNDYTSYIASDGYEYKVGEKIKIGLPSSSGGLNGGTPINIGGRQYNPYKGIKKSFAFIQTGDGFFTVIENATSDASNDQSEILNIFVKGAKRTGYKVYFRTKAKVYRYLIDFENALNSGEIVMKGMNSEKALVELKKAKEKLDLGLIGEREYQMIKTEMSQ